MKTQPSQKNKKTGQSVLEQKKAIVAELSERLKNSLTGVVVSYEGINTEDDTKLRKELRENNVQYTVVKNTLLSRRGGRPHSKDKGEYHT